MRPPVPETLHRSGP